MRYISIQTCALLLLCAILFINSRMRPIDVKSTKTFRNVMYIILACLVCDIFSVICIMNFLQESLGFTRFVCRLYLVSVICVGMGIYKYLLAGQSHKDIQIIIAKIIGYLVAVVGSCMSFAQPLVICYDDSQGELYTYGASVLATYCVTLILIVLTFIGTIVFRKKVNPTKCSNVRIWMIFMAVCGFVQLMNNEFLIIGFAMSLGASFVFERLESPNRYTDTESGLYNASAFKAYINEKYAMGTKVYCLRAALNVNHKGLTIAESSSLVSMFSEFIQKEPGVAFRTSSYSFAIVSENLISISFALEHIHEFFYEGNKKVAFFGIKNAIFVMRKPEIYANAEDFIGSYYKLKLYKLNYDNNISIVNVDETVMNKILATEKAKDVISLALDENRVEVFYQPIYDTRTGLFSSAEALVRIRDKDGKIIMPGDIIPVAEESGLIIPLGERIFSLVCDLLGSDRKPASLDYIEVNLSAVQCKYEALYSTFKSIMIAAGVRPEQINLEITETSRLDMLPRIISMFNEFKRDGIHFSLDDFGTGNSNIDYIASMPMVSIVKFDNFMTNGFFTNERMKSILPYMIEMIKTMGLKIVCEGIESKEHLDIMTGFGIEYIQGYYFSKPLPEGEFLDFINKNNNAALANN